MNIVTIDFETYWDADHSLSKMPAITYCTDPKTQIISLGLKVNGGPTRVVFGQDAAQELLDSVDWSTAMLIGHNLSAFDSMLLAWRFQDVHPKMWGCTAAMARPIHTKTTGNSLAKLVEYYGLGVKDQTVLHTTKGRRLEDFTAQERRDMAAYNAADVDQCYALFHKLRPHYTAKELWHIDASVRMLVESRFEVDTPLLEVALSVERDRKRKTILTLARHMRQHGLGGDAVTEAENLGDLEEAVRAALASAPKFSKLLESLDVPVPMKPSPTTPDKQVPALAKTDDAFIALQSHDNEVVAAAAMARLAVKSTLLETRIGAFMEAAAATGGYLPVPLNYCGADTTGRWSGWAYNPQNLPRIDPRNPKVSDALRNSLKAPRGHKIVVADQSGIELRVNHFLWKVPESMALYAQDRKADLYRAFAAARYGIAPDEVTKQQRQLAKMCIAEGALVLTRCGEIPIEQVTARDLVWDGVEWVGTLGAIYKGEKDVITYDGLTATPDHDVWVADGRKVQFGDAAAQSLRLARTGYGGAPVKVDAPDAERVTAAQPAADGTGAAPARQRVWDLLNCGPRNRFTANGRLVSNCHLGLGFGAGWRTFQNIAKIMGGLDLSDEEAESVTQAWRAQYAEIVLGWRTCHSALQDIYEGVERVIDPWGLCVTCKEGIRLPSGRVIRYPGLHTEPGNDSRPEWWYGAGRHRTRIYAGKIDENCIQALARDTIADNAVDFFRATGHRPQLMVHDELVYVLPEQEAHAALDTLQGIMRAPPTWWPQLVTESEGDIADSYGAAK